MRLKWTDERVEILKSFIARGMTARQIAQEMKCPKNTIYTVARRHDLKFTADRNKFTTAANRTKWTDDKIQTLREMCSAGASIKEIAERIEMSNTAVSLKAKQLRLLRKTAQEPKQESVNRISGEPLQTIRMPHYPCLDKPLEQWGRG